ncbi:aspartyl-phosphate phosphatase Spo0E family protein [Pullulanibacillus sp. KACC 23026]|uniref:aspartyl-phosphate phosphatase Spo0E family protein n=1 Tax=Pullulanibacillus sp. KACC 23026 TaxID=3028315 RepID=UPI0023AEA377|nr:aspartyl-phosphate phosphatase Spo0E family protein [Pullulanibacillus sp. KACC 23026]WEG11776.1 aspartyl-phosphate phosphatase Spo0E family protein [Pullulanibacillus sp. KACC 23026]
MRDEIEKKRQQLILIANKYGLNAELTLKCSRELDRLLDNYQEKTLLSNKNINSATN